VVAAVDLRVAVEAVGKDRTDRLVVKGREVSVALQAVLLGRVLLEHAAIGCSVRRVADHAAIAS